MLIEADRPLTVRLPDGDIRLVPGHPVELPDDQGRKLVQKANGKVRAVAPILLLCRGCSLSVTALHNLGGGKWRCLACVERRALMQS